MEIADGVFKRKIFNEKLLLDYGFVAKDENYEFSVPIMKGRFKLNVIVSKDGISTDVIDLNLNEVFSLYHIEGPCGDYVSQIRLEATKILEDISASCFRLNVFKTRQAMMCIDYIREKYNDELEFLWKKFPDSAIYRRRDNNKWYAALLIINASKLGINDDAMIEIINLKIDRGVDNELFKCKGVFDAYHMNKNNWCTIVLNDSIADSKLLELIDKSYILSKGK